MPARLGNTLEVRDQPITGTSQVKQRKHFINLKGLKTLTNYLRLLTKTNNYLKKSHKGRCLSALRSLVSPSQPSISALLCHLACLRGKF